MQSFLLAKIEDGDFTEGSPLYDHTIQGFAYLFAFLRKKIGVVRARQSLMTLANLPPEESVEDAADAILANLVVTRGQGERARGPGVIYLSQRTDVLIPTTARFFKTQSAAFLLEAVEDVFISSSDLRPVTGADGRTTAWVTPVLNFVATRVGRDFNQPVGPFVGFTRFHPYVTRVENTAELTGGEGAQATSDLIQNASSALSLRALINPSSNAAVIRSRFNVEQVTTITAGAPEMTRDRVVQPGAGIVLHVGGHMDIYVRRPVQQTVERGVVGGSYSRPDGRAVRLTVDAGAGIDFVTGAGITEPVVVGDILSVVAGLPEAPFQYRIVKVEAHALEVSTRLPFSRATVEDPVPATLTFSVGNNYPTFNNKVSGVTHSGTGTERRVSQPGTVVLSGVPVYAIKRIEVIDASSSALAPYKDPTTDTLVFTRRENALPSVAPSPGDALTYTVTTLDSGEAQSGVGATLVQIGWPGAALDGLTAEITYETVSGFVGIDAFVRSETERPGCAFTLAKGLHPIYVALTVPYRLAPQRPDLDGGNVTASFDEGAVADGLANYIAAYRGVGGLDQSLLAAEARRLAGVEVSIFPFNVRYDLLGPDGKVYRFESSDVVTLSPDEATSFLINPGDFGLPSSGYAASVAKRLRDLGVSERVSRYLTLPGSVTLLRRT